MKMHWKMSLRNGGHFFRVGGLYPILIDVYSNDKATHVAVIVKLIVCNAVRIFVLVLRWKDPLSLLRAFIEFGLPISPWCTGFIPELSVPVVERVSNRAVSFYQWALGSKGRATCDFFAELCHCFMALVTLIWPWKPQVCKYGVWGEITCNLSITQARTPVYLSKSAGHLLSISVVKKYFFSEW